MPSESTYLEYRSELNGAKTVGSAQVGVLVVAGLNTAFIALDWLAHSDVFASLVTARLALDLAMIAVYWGLSRANPLRVMLAGLYLTGIGMLTVIGLAGGATSNYWPGMMILFLGIPVMLPVSIFQASMVVSTLSLGFVALPFATGEEWTLQAFMVPVFFVFGAAIECVASTAALERLRFKEFCQRKETEKARDHLKEMDRVKARFTANVHHELRTPLTLTLAPVESLLAGEFGEVSVQQRSYLKTVHVNALRLLKLINNLLDLAKVESGQLEIVRRPISVDQVADDLVSGAMPLADKKGVKLRLAIEPGLPAVNADPDAVEKVIMNLLGNALKFTGNGDEIVVGIDRAGDGGLVCSVRDTGVGLEAGQLERIFDRFAQVDTSATRKHEGTGIGLSLTKELVELHGGKIWAASDGLGMGATISFSLPVGEEDLRGQELALEEGRENPPHLLAGFEAEINAQGNSGGARYSEIERTLDRNQPGFDASEYSAEADGRPRVLICEDNSDMRRLLYDLVGKEFQVELAENGRVGLEAVRRDPPDLVLTDVMMPEMSGIELCAAIKADAATSPIPVVLVTSKAERDMKIAGLENGADDYVTKPFHARELLARVRSLVKLRQMSSELTQRNEALAAANGELAEALTELKDAEAQVIRAERLAAVGELAAGLAHEVNNPVNFALNAARTMGSYVLDLRESLERSNSGSASAANQDSEVAGNASSAPLKDSAEEAVGGIEELTEIIVEGLGRTSRLVGDLRDFAAPGSGERTEIDLRRTVGSALQLTRYFLQEHHVDVVFDPPEGIAAIRGDVGALGQVVLNILKNAAEAFETSGGLIEIGLENMDSGVLLTIADNGPGVPVEDQARLFEPFFSTKPAGAGTGLGLAISRQVVEDHGGTLGLVSTPEHGATFSVWLPVGGCK